MIKIIQDKIMRETDHQNYFDKDTLCLMTVKKLVININLTLLFGYVILLIKPLFGVFEQFYAL
jgi:hypothetical protein